MRVFMSRFSCFTKTKMSSFWRNFHHWLHCKLSFWQLSVQPVMKISSKWRHFRFSVGCSIMIMRIYVFHAVIIIISDIWLIRRYVGLDYETTVNAVCLDMVSLNQFIQTDFEVISIYFSIELNWNHMHCLFCNTKEIAVLTWSSHDYYSYPM